MSDTIQVVCPHCDATNRVPPARLSAGPKCGRCHKALFEGAPVALDRARFDRHLAGSGLPLIVDFWALTRPVTDLVDGAMDRSLVLGYTRIGSGLRRRWWPADPVPDAMAGKRVLVTGATAGIGLAMARAFAELGATVYLLGRNADKVSRFLTRSAKNFVRPRLIDEVDRIFDPVVKRDGNLIMVDDDRFRLKPGEVPQMKSVRFRTLGCYPLTGAVESDAATLPQIIQEMLLTTSSERQGRMIDHDQAATMEKKKQEGYF